MTSNHATTESSFSLALLLDQTPMEVFNSINRVKEWWGAGIVGNSEKTGDEFAYRHKDLHFSIQKVTELVPGQKVVWLVTNSHLSFIENQQEWVGTEISFDLTQEGDKTRLLFTHRGLVPQCSCFDACSGGWNYYLSGSLLQLITTGKGEPDDKSYSENFNSK